MRTAHLFAGSGGGLLADLILGHKPVLAVEHDSKCCYTLRRKAEEGWFPDLHVHEGDVRLFDPSGWKGRVDCIHAGFPCQDISAAGPGRGIDGERSGLVREVFRAIDIIRPKFVFLENSPRIRTRGRDRVVAELVARGYAWRDGILAASDVGAWHDRERWWCLAANVDGLRELEQKGSKQNVWRWSYDGTEKNADTLCSGCQNRSRIATTEESGNIGRPADMASWQKSGTTGETWFEVEPNVGRLVYGVADDMVPGAIKALGNGQVPLQAAAAYILLGGLINDTSQ